MREQGFHERQCTAMSKQHKRRCLNYAMRGRTVCKFHGGKSKRGAAHPNFKFGKRTPSPLADLLKPRPIDVSISVFGMSADEATRRITRGHRLEMLCIPPDQITVGEWLRAMRFARRFLTAEIRKLHDYLKQGAEQAEVVDRDANDRNAVEKPPSDE